MTTSLFQGNSNAACIVDKEGSLKDTLKKSVEFLGTLGVEIASIFATTKWQAILTILGTTYSSFQIHTLQKGIKEIRERVSCMDVNIEYLQSPTFVDDIYHTTKSLEREDSKWKARYFVNYFTECCKLANKDKIRHELLLRKFEELEFFDVFVLNNIPAEVCRGCMGYVSSLQHKYAEISGNDFPLNIFQNSIDHLCSIGVVAKCSEEDVQNRFRRSGNISTRFKHDIYKRTSLGNDLHRFMTYEYIKA